MSESSLSVRVVEAIYLAIDDFNQNAFRRESLRKNSDQPLFGQDGALDSLELASFIVAAEQSISDHLGVSVTLADEKAMAWKSSPFRSVGSLAEYVVHLVDNRASTTRQES